MPGRRAKPMQLHLYEGKSRLTTAEKKARLELEESFRFGDHNFKAPPEVKKDKNAYKKWNETVKRYIKGEIEFVTTADSGLLAEYCIVYSQYLELLEVKRAGDEETKRLDASDNNKLLSKYMNLQKQKFYSNFKNICILLVKYEKELYLTPQSRIQTLGKNKKEEPKDEHSQKLKELFGE